MPDQLEDAVTILSRAIDYKNDYIRYLEQQLEEAKDTIVEYELDAENEDKFNEAVATDFLEALEFSLQADSTIYEIVDRFQSLFDKYFEEAE